MTDVKNITNRFATKEVYSIFLQACICLYGKISAIKPWDFLVTSQFTYSAIRKTIVFSEYVSLSAKKKEQQRSKVLR